MSKDNPYLKAYRNTTITTTVSKTKQVIMFYDAIINFLKLTKKAIIENNIADRYNYSIKATKIIEGLQACLDVELGGDVTILLDKFYNSIFTKIMNINLKNCPIQCESIIEEVRLMRSAWVEVDEKTNISSNESKNLPPENYNYSA